MIRASTYLNPDILRQFLRYPFLLRRHQIPIVPSQEESFPLQREMREQRRQLHAHYFIEVITPNPDNSLPPHRRMMVTEVDQEGVHRNRQPEFFFNGIIGHIRANQNGWIDSWGQASHIANYWRRHFQIPEIHSSNHWYQQSFDSDGENDRHHTGNVSHEGSDMDDSESVEVHVDHGSAPAQIHQLATILWNALNNDRAANLAILDRLDESNADPVQIFSAADLAHLASHLAHTMAQLSQTAATMEAVSDLSE